MNGTAVGNEREGIRSARRARLETEEIAHPARQRALRVSGVQPGATDIHGGDRLLSWRA